MASSLSQMSTVAKVQWPGNVVIVSAEKSTLILEASRLGGCASAIVVRRRTRLGVEGQMEPERRAGTFGAVEADPPTMRLDDLAAERQPEPGAADVPRV